MSLIDHSVMVLVSVQVVQGDAKWGPHFKFTLFKFL